MGIPHLNRLILTECHGAVRKACLSELANKTLTVDASIYLHKFNLSGSIVDGFYQLLVTLRRNGIRAVFVFDGAAPDAKAPVIARRRRERDNAESRCESIRAELRTAAGAQRVALLAELRAQRRKATRLPWGAYAQAQHCILAAGMAYCQAEGEADAVCVRMVVDGIAWGCLSDDMDMLAYGCPRVLRALSLAHGTVDVYDLSAVLDALGVDAQSFQLVCALVRNDYNDAPTSRTLSELMHSAAALDDPGRLLQEFPERTQVGAAKALEQFGAPARTSVPPVQMAPYRQATWEAFLDENDFVVAPSPCGEPATA